SSRRLSSPPKVGRQWVRPSWRLSIWSSSGNSGTRPMGSLLPPLDLHDHGRCADRPMVAAAKAVQAAEKSKALAFFPVGVDGADFNVLLISPRIPIKLRGLAFRDCSNGCRTRF